MSFCWFVHRLSTMGSPARLMTAWQPDNASMRDWYGVCSESNWTVVSDGDDAKVDLAAVGDRVSRTTEFPDCNNVLIRSLPMNPVPPVTAIFMFPYGAEDVVAMSRDEAVKQGVKSGRRLRVECTRSADEDALNDEALRL
mmetsp:Transcript_8052/g.14604  ORF Transcript_8052/g.14604 Transcript_8052/m.14604 type:complete len:140 (-) Transcript_8052:25-444(-)